MVNDEYLLLNEVVDTLPFRIERIRLFIIEGTLPVYVSTNAFRGSENFCNVGKYCRANLPISYQSDHIYFSTFNVFDKNGKFMGVTSGIYMWPETHNGIRFKKDDVYRLKMLSELEVNNSNNNETIAPEVYFDVKAFIDNCRDNKMGNSAIVYGLMINYGKSVKYSKSNDIRLSALSIGIAVFPTTDPKTNKQKEALEQKVWRAVRKFAAK